MDSQKAPAQDAWTLVGMILLAVSIGLIIWASNMRPTVEMQHTSDFGLSPPGATSEVFNSGLLQQQMMIFLSGLFGLVLGAISLATASILKIIGKV